MQSAHLVFQPNVCLHESSPFCEPMWPYSLSGNSLIIYMLIEDSWVPFRVTRCSIFIFSLCFSFSFQCLCIEPHSVLGFHLVICDPSSFCITPLTVMGSLGFVCLLSQVGLWPGCTIDYAHTAPFPFYRSHFSINHFLYLSLFLNTLLTHSLQAWWLHCSEEQSFIWCLCQNYFPWLRCYSWWLILLFIDGVQNWRTNDLNVKQSQQSFQWEC